MPREGKSTITVDDETAKTLKEDKPDGVTWDEYLWMKCISESGENVNPQPPITTTTINTKATGEFEVDTMGLEANGITVEWIGEGGIEPDEEAFNWPVLKFRHTENISNGYISTRLTFSDQTHLLNFGKRCIVEARQNGYGESAD